MVLISVFDKTAIVPVKNGEPSQTFGADETVSGIGGRIPHLGENPFSAVSFRETISTRDLKFGDIAEFSSAFLLPIGGGVQLGEKIGFFGSAVLGVESQ